MDSWLTRMYERHGVRYLWGVVVAILGIEAVFVGPADVSVPAHYEGLTLKQALVAMLAAEVVTLSFGGLVVLSLRRDFHALAAWARGARSPRLRDEAAAAAFNLPRRIALRMVPVFLLVTLPLGVVLTTAPVGRLDELDAVEILLGGLFAGVFSILLFYSLSEFALRPVRAGLGFEARPDATPLGFGAKLLLVLLFPMISGVFVGGLLVERDSGSLMSVYGLSLIATVMGVVVMTALLRSGALGPVRDLIRGTRAVAGGDLDTRVPVTSDDEIGELTGSFNQMVRELGKQAADLRASQARIVAAADESRRKVERDLHDGAQQSLVLLNLKLGLAERKLAADPKHAAGILAEARADLDRGLDELRDLAHGIYPQVLTSDGIGPALEEAAAGSGGPVSVSAGGAGRYPPEVEAAVYFCCLEALQNVGKYAGEGASATVLLAERDGSLFFEVADDGAGFDPASVNGSAGLQNMADRIGALGGELGVESAPGSGARVAGSVPLAR